MDMAQCDPSVFPLNNSGHCSSPHECFQAVHRAVQNAGEVAPALTRRWLNQRRSTKLARTASVMSAPRRSAGTSSTCMQRDLTHV